MRRDVIRPWPSRHSAVNTQQKYKKKETSLFDARARECLSDWTGNNQQTTKKKAVRTHVEDNYQNEAVDVQQLSSHRGTAWAWVSRPGWWWHGGWRPVDARPAWPRSFYTIPVEKNSVCKRKKKCRPHDFVLQRQRLDAINSWNSTSTTIKPTWLERKKNN